MKGVESAATWQGDCVFAGVHCCRFTIGQGVGVLCGTLKSPPLPGSWTGVPQQQWHSIDVLAGAAWESYLMPLSGELKTSYEG